MGIVYEPTHHAVVRAKERVDIKGKGAELKNNVKSWINHVMPYAIYTGESEGGRRHYRYKKWNIIVTNENIVVTISFYKGKEDELAADIRKMVERKIENELKPLKRKLRETYIKMHEAEIRKHKSYNPKSVQSIQKDVDEMKLTLSAIENRMNDINSLRNQYELDRWGESSESI